MPKKYKKVYADTFRYGIRYDYVFLEDKFIVNSVIAGKAGHAELEYKSIYKVEETINFIQIFANKKNAFILKKDKEEVSDIIEVLRECVSRYKIINK